MIKVASFVLLSAFSVAFCEDVVVEVNEKGCPLNYTVYKILPHENCNEFYQCVGGEPIALACPDGLMFNKNLDVCDWPYHVECEERIITTIAPSDSSEENDEVSALCAQDDSDGLLVPHEYCNHMYICARRTPVDLTCPEPLLYNTERKLCDWEDKVDCGERLKVDKTQ